MFRVERGNVLGHSKPTRNITPQWSDLMSNERLIRKIAVIFVTDVVGFSTLMERNEALTLNSLRACRAILEDLFQEHSGRIFNTAGDSVLAEFQSAVSATICATEFQKLIQERNTSVAPEAKMHFRVGLNMGDVIVEGSNLYGEGVNVAARLEALSQAGGVCLSKNLYDFVSQKVELSFNDLGTQKIKNTHVHAYDIALEGIAARNTASAKPAVDKATNKPPSVAVLPFVNMSNDPDQEYFADGVTEDIITNLSMWKTFPVISRNSSFSFKGTGTKSKEIALQLGARYLVEGSIRKGGDKVRITANLIDANDDRQIWSKRWDRALDDIFDVQDEVSQEVAAMVSPTLRGQEQKRAANHKTENLSAWDEYIKALSAFNAEADFETVEDLCHRAFALDKQFTDPYFLYTKALLKLRYSPQGYTQKDVIFEKLSRAAKFVYGLDPENSAAINCMVNVHWMNMDIDRTLALSQKALDINPYDSNANFSISVAYAQNGDFESGIRHLNRAFELDPVSKRDWTVALIMMNIGADHLDHALSLANNALADHASDTRYLGFKTVILGLLGQEDAAAVCLSDFLANRPEINSLDDYEKVAPDAIKQKALTGMRKAGLH